MYLYGMLFIETSTLPPSMSQKHTKHERCNIQNNQRLTKSHVELEDNPYNVPCFQSRLCDVPAKGVCEANWRNSLAEHPKSNLAARSKTTTTIAQLSVAIETCPHKPPICMLVYNSKEFGHLLTYI